MRLFIGLATALQLWSGLSDPLLDDAGYVPRNLVVTAGLLLLARRVGSAPTTSVPAGGRCRQAHAGGSRPPRSSRRAC